MKYKNRVRSRISNLKDPKNPGLRKNVLAGTLALSRIASMSAEVGVGLAEALAAAAAALLHRSLSPSRKWRATS